MTPRKVDTKGLSATVSLETAKYGKNQIIDVRFFSELTAICDNPMTGHVSIYPKNFETMPNWMESRENTTEMHPLTEEVINAIVGDVKI